MKTGKLLYPASWQKPLCFLLTSRAGYHHIEIFEGHQTYLGFSWRHGSSNFTKFYVFTVLLFGLSSAPHIFTKTLKPLEKHWRHQGICIAIQFLDDGWAIERDRQVCSSVSKAVKADLSEAGFITNDEKSTWEPCQRIDWLGLTWDSALGTIEIVDRRCAKILATIDSIVDSGFVISARNLASFTGQIISTSPVSGNISRIMTRHCVLSTLSVQHWEDKIELDQYCIEELAFLEKLIWTPSRLEIVSSFISLNVSFIPMPVLRGVVQCSPLMRNISAIGFGSHPNAPKVLLGESLPPLIFLSNRSPQFWRGSLLKWFTDSQSAAKIVEVGSMKLDLHRLAVKIFQFCAEHNIRLEVQWIPRTENEKADYISRLIDYDDWADYAGIFSPFRRVVGSAHGWLFLLIFIQRNYQDSFPASGTRRHQGWTFFVQNLESENCLVVPPVSLIARALHYLSLQKARATIVIPVWPSSSFWPLLTSQYKPFMKDCFQQNGSEALTLGRNLNSFLGSVNFTGNIVAVRLEFL